MYVIQVTDAFDKVNEKLKNSTLHNVINLFLYNSITYYSQSGDRKTLDRKYRRRSGAKVTGATHSFFP